RAGDTGWSAGGNPQAVVALGEIMVQRHRRLLLVSVLLLSLFGSPVPGMTQELTLDDLRRIAFTAQRSFEHILQLWKDKRFAELYEFGTFASQVDLSPEAFERYMSYASRTLECCWLLL